MSGLMSMNITLIIAQILITKAILKINRKYIVDINLVRGSLVDKSDEAKNRRVGNLISKS